MRILFLFMFGLTLVCSHAWSSNTEQIEVYSMLHSSKVMKMAAAADHALAKKTFGLFAKRANYEKLSEGKKQYLKEGFNEALSRHYGTDKLVSLDAHILSKHFSKSDAMMLLKIESDPDFDIIMKKVKSGDKLTKDESLKKEELWKVLESVSIVQKSQSVQLERRMKLKEVNRLFSIDLNKLIMKVK